MARYRRNRMSLYEAMTRSRRKGSYGRTLERLRPEKTQASPSATPRQATEDKPAEEKSDVQIPLYQATTTWWRRTKTVQFNTGRIDFSMSYPVAVALVLGLILLVLLAFRAGQYSSFLSKKSAGDSSAKAVSSESPHKSGAAGVVDESSVETKAELTTPASSPAAPKALPEAGPSGSLKAGNVIVLVEYPKRADLVPVQKHFAKFGIETEIVSRDGKYFLVTKNRYEGFGAGSDGYEAKQKIVEVGAKYKAPQGYETFAPLFFKDAYGRKIE